MEIDLQDIRSQFSKEVISTDVADLEAYGKDWTKIHAPNPCAIAFPRSTEEVSKLLKICNESSIAVVPSGGRTGLAGGAVAAKGELVLSLSRMNKIGPINVLSLTLPVQAGAITEMVHEFCEPYGVTWPVDFGSKGSSTVGGNIATNAGGINVIRYGMTRNWVLGLTVVTMAGQILELNGPLEKNNTGLDLKHLFIGSEGILGIVTEATLKLTRIEKNLDLYFFGVKDMASVFNLLEKARSAPFDIYAFEVFSRNCFEASYEALGLRSPFEGSHEQYVLLDVKGEKIDEWLEEVFEKGMVEEGVQPKSTEERKQFWKAREGIAEFLAVKGLNHSNDISVPIFNLKPFIDEWTALFRAKYSNWTQYVFGHIGDGNLHIHALKPEGMKLEEFLAKTKIVDEDLFKLVQKYKGSISAEHGIGLLKKPHLKYSKTPAELAILKAVKKDLDPKGLLNPGKVID